MKPGETCNRWLVTESVSVYLSSLAAMCSPKSPLRRMSFPVSPIGALAQRLQRGSVTSIVCSRTFKAKGRDAKSGRRGSKFVAFSNGSSIFAQNRGASAFVEDSRKMNARPEIRDALLVQRMKHWLIRATSFSSSNCPKWRAKKNFWALVRKHRALAERNGLRETSVF